MPYFEDTKGVLYFMSDADMARKTILVDDPNWVRPTVQVPDPDWTAPADNPTATAPMITVPDWSAVCPKISVPNPNFTLPTDAVQITDAEGQAIENPTITLQQAQALQIADIYKSYQTAIAQNVAYTSKGGVAQTFQADPTSAGYVNSMLSAYGAAGATPAGFYWVAADNTQVPFTYADLQGLANAMGAQGWAAFQKLQGYKSQIKAATTVAAVQAVVWS